MYSAFLRAILPALLAGVWTRVCPAATLEKLTIEQMAQKSTLIVRGRVTGCAGEMHGSIIYTRCSVAVSERWKGSAPGTVTFVIPGGSSHGLTQTFTGTPKFADGSEYVLFLWAGRSGTNQIIGLTQGAFDVAVDAQGKVSAKRAASSELMLDSSGSPVQDTPVQLSTAQLRRRVSRVLAAGAAK